MNNSGTGIKSSVRQVIVFSHYRKFIRNFIETDSSIRLIEIIKGSKTSYIKKKKIDKFIKTPHEKEIDRIFHFIEREHDDDIIRELRVFLEQEIKMRFRKQIYDLGIESENIGCIIKTLQENNHINIETKRKLKSYKDRLNPEHHRFDINNKEDQRKFAKQMVEYIYGELAPII